MRSTIKSVMKINNPQYDSCINSRKNFVKLILHNWNILNDVCNLWNWKVFDKLRRFREINFHYEVSNSLANKVSFTVILNLIAKTMIALFGNKSFDFWIFMWEDVYFCTYFEQHLSKKHCFLVSIPSENRLENRTSILNDFLEQYLSNICNNRNNRINRNIRTFFQK